jgi:hypothetical protein
MVKGKYHLNVAEIEQREQVLNDPEEEKIRIDYNSKLERN